MKYHSLPQIADAIGVTPEWFMNSLHRNRIPRPAGVRGAYILTDEYKLIVLKVKNTHHWHIHGSYALDNEFYNRLHEIHERGAVDVQDI